MYAAAASERNIVGSGVEAEAASGSQLEIISA
jgi:hypothetical protein